jgi:chitodextrinase
MRAHEFIIEGKIHGVEPKVLPIIPDNMPFGANQFKDPTGAFQGGGMSTTPISSKAPTTTEVPFIQNKIATPPEKSNILTGRAPSSPEDITHAYRNMSPAELQHAQANGAFLPNPDPGRTPGWKPYEKWWSPGDAQGTFDRARNRIGAGTKVRVPIDKVPSDSPVNASHAEVLNKETGEWLPVIQP